MRQSKVKSRGAGRESATLNTASSVPRAPSLITGFDTSTASLLAVPSSSRIQAASRSTGPPPASTAPPSTLNASSTIVSSASARLSASMRNRTVFELSPASKLMRSALSKA